MPRLTRNVSYVGSRMDKLSHTRTEPPPSTCMPPWLSLEDMQRTICLCLDWSHSPRQRRCPDTFSVTHFEVLYSTHCSGIIKVVKEHEFAQKIPSHNIVCNQIIAACTFPSIQSVTNTLTVRATLIFFPLNKPTESMQAQTYLRFV